MLILLNAIQHLAFVLVMLRQSVRLDHELTSLQNKVTG